LPLQNNLIKQIWILHWTWTFPRPF
jgi:hypothetical protein